MWCTDNRSVLKQVLSTKYLGLYISLDKITIDYVLKKIKGKIYSINHLNPPSTVRKLLHQVYLLPILTIVMLCRHPLMLSNQTKHLERLHSEYISSCTNSRYSITEQQKFYYAMQVYEVLHKSAPAYLHNIFKCHRTFKQKFASFELFVSHINTKYGKHSFYYCRTTLWNALQMALSDQTHLEIHIKNILVMLVCT